MVVCCACQPLIPNRGYLCRRCQYGGNCRHRWSSSRCRHTRQAARMSDCVIRVIFILTDSAATCSGLCDHSRGLETSAIEMRARNGGRLVVARSKVAMPIGIFCVGSAIWCPKAGHSRTRSAQLAPKLPSSPVSNWLYRITSTRFIMNEAGACAAACTCVFLDDVFSPWVSFADARNYHVQADQLLVGDRFLVDPGKFTGCAGLSGQSSGYFWPMSGWRQWCPPSWIARVR